MRRSPLPKSLRLALLRVWALLVVAMVGSLGVNGFLMVSSDCCPPKAAAVEESHEDGCCDADQAGDTEGTSGEPCPCPLPCNPGCAGQSMRALVSGAAGVIGEPAGRRIEQPISIQARPPEPEPADIVHVPKSIRS